MRVRIATNLAGLAAARVNGVEPEIVPLRRGRTAAERWRAAREALGCDYAVVNCSPPDLFELCAAKALLPFSRCRIVSLDTVLPVPRTDTVSRRAGLAAKRFLFRRAALFIEYFRDTRGYERYYGIPRERFRYVPFKINRYERVLQTPVSDEGYVFCGGNTRRDFATLIAAARQLPYPVRIVTMAESVIGGHGSTLDERNLPPNVTVVRHDGSESFLAHVAASRLVALPILRENISASGIGVYLASMALGKCVVISEGPAVNGVVPDGAAVIVPPEDPEQLAAAIERAWTDDAWRIAVADSGRRYALSLGGEERLCASVLDVLAADALTERPASRRT